VKLLHTKPEVVLSHRCRHPEIIIIIIIIKCTYIAQDREKLQIVYDVITPQSVGRFGRNLVV